MSRIVLAGREVWPFVEGGGIGRYVWTTASMLAPHHDVTILTTAAHRDAHERLRTAGDARLPAGVAFAFADEPVGDVTPYSSFAHAWSARLLEALVALGPDVVEFGDYTGEGFATVHARRGGDPRLRRTTVAVRTHTSGEIVAALNEAPPEPANAVLWALERFAIRHADVLLWPGGDVLDRYRGFYGRITAEPLRLPLPVLLADLEPPGAGDPPRQGPLRLLFLNRLERRKGIVELLEALRSEPAAEIALTVVGRDTDTAPGGGSMRAHAETLADERVAFRDQVPHGEVPRLIAEHHAVAVPVRWETFSYVTREALAAGRPVLATPAGAIPEVVIPGRSGWLQTGLAGVDRAAAERMIAAGGPREALEASLVGEQALAAAYAELAAREPWKAPSSPPHVAAVVTVREGDAGVERTLRSLRAQRGAQVAIQIDAAPDAIPPAHLLIGTGGARAGLALRIPAGAELDPAFCARAAEALAANPSAAYVTANVARGRRPWHAPLGGEDLPDAGVDAAASVALVRADLPGDGDLAGLPGIVLQEPLVRRLPRRQAAAQSPADGGAPSPAATRAAFPELSPAA